MSHADLLMMALHPTSWPCWTDGRGWDADHAYRAWIIKLHNAARH